MKKKEMPDILMADEKNKGKRLCLHSCCAPCSSYCLLYLSVFFRITVFYHNPNIDPEGEFEKRADAQQRLIEEYKSMGALSPERADELIGRLSAGAREKHPELCEWIKDRLTAERYAIEYVKSPYDNTPFYEAARGLENEPEKGARCHACYGLRLSETCRYADKAGGFDLFATTLTLSPLKDAAAINAIGKRIAASSDTAYLATDFKKKNGYLISILLSEIFGLYRQDYCGCIYSKRQKGEDHERIS